MNNRNRKVARYRKPRNINIGVIIFSILFLYISINIIIYLSKDKLAIYQVVDTTIADDNGCTGIILREEEAVTTKQEGYVNYYVRDGEKVGKNGVVYSLNPQDNVAETLAESTKSLKLSKNDIKNIRQNIADFKQTYRTSNYNVVYNFKSDIENTILDSINTSAMNSIKKYTDGVKDTSIFNLVKTKKSGIVSYYSDGLENLTEQDITTKTFEKDNYKNEMLRSNEKKEKGNAVYRLVTSEDWKLILNISKEQYEKLLDKKYVRITFKKDQLSLTVPVTTYERDGGYFAKILMNSYMIRYVDDRFVSVELHLNSARGLKIPNSSIIEKSFFKIPREYFTYGGNKNEVGINTQQYTKQGEVKYQFISTPIYYQDDECGYVDMSQLKAGDVIINPETQKTYTVSETASLQGVYNVNKGYSIFRRIEVVYENEEYSIVKNNTKLGLSEYDHIILDAKTAIESKVIY